jgi:hypothetical protein
MEKIVCKFGGTSLADATQIRKVRAIVESDARRRFVVVSAPGKRNKNDAKSPICCSPRGIWRRSTWTIPSPCA